jgi:hypothetical protein
MRIAISGGIELVGGADGEFLSRREKVPDPNTTTGRKEESHES